VSAVVWAVTLTAAAAALAWHEIGAHHLAPGDHHDAWTRLGSARRGEIQAEMLLTGVLYAAVTGLWPAVGLPAALVTAAAAAVLLVRGRRS
jgi:hypothetical protein